MNPNDKRTSLYSKERAVFLTASFRSSVLSLTLDILHEPTQKKASKSFSSSILQTAQKQKGKEKLL